MDGSEERWCFPHCCIWWMGIKLSYSSKQQCKGLLELQRELLNDTGDGKV